MTGLPNLGRQQKRKGAGIHIRSAADVVTSTIFPRLLGALVLLPPLFSHCSSLILLVPPWAASVSLFDTANVLKMKTECPASKY